MRAEAERAGRDPDALELTLGHSAAAITPERAERLRELWAPTASCSPSRRPTDLAAAKDELSACAQRLGLIT